VIAVTDSKVSPIAKNADVVIIASNASTSLLPTVIPFLAIAQALATLLVSESSEEAMQRIARSEEQLASFRVYHEDLPRKRPGTR
jgi:DNA-binding MurR/RpiR family transcriptional regulator